MFTRTVTPHKQNRFSLRRFHLRRFRLNRFRLRFRLSLTSVFWALPLIVLFCSLSVWQYHRAQYKQSLTLALQNGSHYSATGYFLNTFHILHDNQTFNRKVGYHVLTPFVVTDSANTIMLVHRGFIPIENNRDHIPNIPPIEGQVQLQGILVKPKKGFTLTENTPFQILQQEPMLLRVQTLDLKKISTHLEKPILPLILHLDSKTPYNFTPTPVMIGISANKHLGYAFQWGALAVLTFIYFLVINMRNEKAQ